MITTPNLEQARKEILKLKKEKPDEKIIILSQDDEFNRKILEIKGIYMLLINEELNQKDYMKQRNSSLNEVLAKLAAKNNIELGIEIDKILEKSDIEKAKSLAKLAQNIMLCKKAKTKLVFFTETQKDKKALEALLLTLGASTEQAMQGLNNL